MDESPATVLPTAAPQDVPLTIPRSRAWPLPRWLAGLQVLLVCGIPTQVVLVVLLTLGAGVPIFENNQISIELFALVSLTDTALVALLIRVFLTMSGETSNEVFVGVRPVRGEVLRGLALLPIVYLGVTGIVLGLRAVAPWMHNVETSPLEGYLQTPIEAAIMLMVVVLAGGVREELQRAFILHRFEQRLGGVKVGLALFSIAFGALHTDQGYDVALAVGLLGLLWGVLYIKRRSAIVAMANHASFNAAQVIQAVLIKMAGG